MKLSKLSSQISSVEPVSSFANGPMREFIEKAYLNHHRLSPTNHSTFMKQVTLNKRELN